jgi:hypothetical protein
MVDYIIKNKAAFSLAGRLLEFETWRQSIACSAVSEP